MRAAQTDAAPAGDGVLPLVLTQRVLISVGSGGVGKTTVAASVALLAARRGRKTLVMTIDPARRLATSLGLEALDNDQREVPVDKLADEGLPAGRMFAMMLDQKRTFDEMVQRYAPDAASVERLSRSKIYQQMTARLAGSQEYAAMEKLHAIHEEGAFDLLVLDTPPTANALDFLDAPQKMVSAVESPAINLFIRSYRSTGRLSLNLLGFGAAYVVRRLARFTGGGFLDDIAGFLTDLSGLLGGMHDRAAQVRELLSRPDAAFIIVTSPDPHAIDEAIAFYDRLSDSGMTLGALVINRVHSAELVEIESGALARELMAAEPALEEEAALRLAEVMLRDQERMATLGEVDAREIRRLKEHCGHEQRYIEVPLFGQDIHDIAGLAHLGEHI